MQRDLEAPLVRDMIEITTRLVGPPQDQPARWLRAGSAPSYSLQAVDAKLSAGSGQWRVLPGLGGRPAGGKLAGAVALRASSREDPALVRRCAGSATQIRYV